MLLYRYFPCTVLPTKDGSYNFDALDTLRQAHLKTSRISSYNDPFEYRFKGNENMSEADALEMYVRIVSRPGYLERNKTTDPAIKTSNDLIMKILEDQKSAARIKKTVLDTRDQRVDDLISVNDKNYRVVAFSEVKISPIDEVIMWSHYANKHQGIRIGFEFPDDPIHGPRIERIQYDNERVYLDDKLMDEDEGEFQKQLLLCMTRKSKAWEYEKEFRLMTSVQRCRAGEDGEEYFLEFDRHWIKFVDFGLRCKTENIRLIAELVKADYPHAVSRMAKFHKSEYALEFHLF